ncbi:MAG: hypothetical protein IKQ66_04990 [Treponema sp.]|jgi:hypothetical protein|nr:hypothetical protein [Treponema sp.]MBR6080838.1 hypothetical protein [Treponema sp.]MBR6193500.1 hypothetical protein [Treponema sp.]
MPVSKTLSAKNKNNAMRIKELQQKIQDENYINFAVERIALVVSRQIVEKRNSLHAPEKTY